MVMKLYRRHRRGLHLPSLSIDCLPLHLHRNHKGGTTAIALIAAVTIAIIAAAVVAPKATAAVLVHQHLRARSDDSKPSTTAALGNEEGRMDVMMFLARIDIV